MPVIRAERVALAAELAAALGVPVHPAWPTAVDPPCAFITPPPVGDYLVIGPTFREHTLSLDVVIVVDHGPVQVAVEPLEDLIELAVHALADWALRSVDPPAPTTIVENGAEYLAVVMHLSKPVLL